MIRNAVGVMLLGAAFAAGCANQLNNPFKDSGAASRAEETTPSATYYTSRDDGARPPPLRREGRGTTAYYESGTVTHWPVWFEDPFEDKGNDRTDPADRDAPDNRFALNGADVLAGFYSPLRFAVNGFGLPFSAIVQPPGWLMASDGKLSRQALGYDHDSNYAILATEPPDTNNLNRRRDLSMSNHAAADAMNGAAPTEAAPASDSAKANPPSGDYQIESLNGTAPRS